MRRIVTKGVILHRINYAEADRIITVLSQDTGRQTLIAKGARKLRSKLAGGIEIFAINELSYLPGKSEIATLVSAKMIKNYQQIIKDQDITTDIYHCLQWLYRYTESGQGQDYYRVIVGSLELADSKQPVQGLAYVYFFVNCLQISGQGINPYHDAGGNKLIESDNYRYDFDQQRFVADQDGKIEKNDIKTLRLLLSGDITLISRLNLESSSLMRLREIIEYHLAEY